MRFSLRPATLGLVAALAACATLQQSVDQQEKAIPLPNTQWEVHELAGERVDGKPPTLIFAEQNRSYGFAGCNRFFAQYDAKGNRLVISNVGSTRMSCDQARNEIEQRFLRSLLAVRNVASDNSSIRLLNEQGDSLMELHPNSQVR